MWKAGYGAAEIMPQDLLEKGYFISGYGSNKKITGVLDPLFVRTIILSAGGFCASFTVFDLTGMTLPDANDMRAAIRDAVGDAVDSVNIAFTHSHAAIDTTGLWGNPLAGISGKDESYMRLCAKQAAQSAADALTDFREGELFFGQAMVPSVLADPRIPWVTIPHLSRFRFVPSDGSPGIALLHFNAHPEALGGENTLASCDYPGEMLKIYSADTGERALFINGCVGGMQTNMPLCGPDGEPLSKVDNMRFHGRILAKAAQRLADSPCPETLLVASEELLLPLSNRVFEMAAKFGILRESLIPFESETGLAKQTEVGVCRIGDVKIALVPGEIFPELAVGGFLSEYDCANPGVPPEGTIRDIFGAKSVKDFLVFGLANDEIGYILPENDFFVDDDTPYMKDAYDKTGRKHYEETNSVGPKTAGCILNALDSLAKRHF